jgi:hypothetical protein
MSRKPPFANLCDHTPPASLAVAQTPDLDRAPAGQAQTGHTIGGQGATTGPASRQGRKQIAGFFSPEMSFAMHTLARRQGRSL